MGFENNSKYTDIDTEYKKNLAENLSCPVKNLSSVVAPQEFKALLNKYKKDNFHTGDFLAENFDERYENVLNKTFRANLHIHTINSDGMMTVEEVLNQAVLYAKSVKSKTNDDLPLFMISITDHDSLEGTKNVLKLISENPEKYTDIKFVSGVEFSAILDNKEILKNPVAVDLMGYCINPFDYDLNKFIQNIKDLRFQEAENILSKLPEFGIFEDLETIKKSHILIKNAASIAFFVFIKNYLYKKYKENKEVKRHREQIEKLFESKQSQNSPLVNEIADIINNSFGYIGLAHPERIHLGKLDESKVKTKEQGLYLLLKESIDNGALAIESNYQYTVRHYSENLSKYMRITKLICEEFDLIETGGTDSHRANIFSHTEDLSQEQLNSLLRS